MILHDGPRRIEHVAIIGAGFAGSLQAINLVRHGGPRATLIERRDGAGRGVAYSAAHPGHLLNVRAGNMSALPDKPDHFVRWLAERHPEVHGFAPRLVYGDYLEELLADTRQRAPERVSLCQAEAVDIQSNAQGVRVLLRDGGVVDADAAVLAVGNLPPHEPPILAAAGLPPGRYVADPWGSDLASGLEPGSTVLTIGAGLTMIDVALLLEARGFDGRLIALSRRGLLPRAHGEAGIPPASLAERPTVGASELLKSVRARARAIGWRASVDELRPFTQSLWLAADEPTRRRFLRHLRPWWDVHRHRLAPEVAARIAALQASGRLQIIAGKLVAIENQADAARVSWRPRGSEGIETAQVSRIVNCSGPQGDLGRTDDPLLRRLLEKGMIRPDALRIGIDVNAQSEVIGASGSADPRLIALGPPTRGTFWEIVAVPDIRMQTWSVARRLANAHWVGGEGL
jgi:uncharacterized NAD(P)/FAD-binding protein YdhS